MRSFRFLRANFNSDPNIGLYGFATDKYCLLGIELNKKLKAKARSLLKAGIKTCTVAGTEFAGIFAAGNSSGIVLPKIAVKMEIQKLRKLLPDVNILVLNAKQTALGNLILCNDKGALISNKLKTHAKKISDCLDCETETGKIAGMEIVGSVGIASNTGCLCHSNSSEEEIRKIESLLNVSVDIGSVSYGSPFVKAGLIVNSFAALTSENSTGPELQRIGEVFDSENGDG